MVYTATLVSLLRALLTPLPILLLPPVQLFGDTMNTASRMETTGRAGRIQLSETTAALLRAAGHGSWYRPRDDLVAVKGKGSMQTYWLESPPHNGWSAARREACAERPALEEEVDLEEAVSSHSI